MPVRWQPLGKNEWGTFFSSSLSGWKVSSEGDRKGEQSVSITTTSLHFAGYFSYSDEHSEVFSNLLWRPYNMKSFSVKITKTSEIFPLTIVCWRTFWFFLKPFTIPYILTLESPVQVINKPLEFCVRNIIAFFLQRKNLTSAFLRYIFREQRDFSSSLVPQFVY